MILGDGNLGNYPKCQYLRIYCNLKEIQYAKEIKKIIEKVFGKKSYCYKRPSEGVLYLEISLKNLDKLLSLPVGDKIINKPRVPLWIFTREKYITSCLRGLFDTDGCCYLTGGKYRVVNYTNKNTLLLKDIYKMLKLLKFNPFKRGNRNIELGRQQEIKIFFSIIRPKNIKHYRHNV